MIETSHSALVKNGLEIERRKSSVIGWAFSGGFWRVEEKCLQGRGYSCRLCQTDSILLQRLAVGQRDGVCLHIDQVGVMAKSLMEDLVNVGFYYLFIY